MIYDDDDLLTFGGVYIVGVDVIPNMSPKRPVVEGATPPDNSVGPLLSWKKKHLIHKPFFF